MRTITVYLLFSCALILGAGVCLALPLGPFQWALPGICLLMAGGFIREAFIVHPAEKFLGPRL